MTGGRAAIVAVGSELLTPGRRDTNAAWLAERLRARGVALAGRTIVPDDEDRIADAVRDALRAAEIVLLTGGLGPTDDDRTRAGVAKAVAAGLERDDARVELLRARFREFGVPFTPPQARQADRPVGASWIENPVGSAAGFEIVLADGKLVAAFPGVPRELYRMFDAWAPARLPAGDAFVLRRLKIAGMPESTVDERVRELYALDGIEVSILGSPEGVELRVQAGGPGAARRVSDFEREARARLSPSLWGVDDEELAAVVGGRLRDRGRTLATAESCTGGGLGARFTDVPGASGWYRGGVVAYHDEVKRGLLGVSRQTLDAHGAVSEAVATEMAAGVRGACGADWGVSITGIAGPGGGSPAKPVGTVWIGVADGGGAGARGFRLPGDREAIRRRSIALALWALARRLTAVG